LSIELSSKDLFIEEIKNQNDKDFDLKNSLDSKSNYLIPISGIVISLIFGFGVTFLQRIDIKYELFWAFQILLIITLISHLFSIFCAVLSFKIRDHRYAFLYFNFYDKKGKMIESEIDEYTEANEVDFKDMILREYLRCNFQNSRNNQCKANWIRISQYSLLVGLGFLSLMIAMLFLYPPTFR
jgi:hypothetical protein